MNQKRLSPNASTKRNSVTNTENEDLSYLKTIMLTDKDALPLVSWDYHVAVFGISIRENKNKLTHKKQLVYILPSDFFDGSVDINRYGLKVWTNTILDFTSMLMATVDDCTMSLSHHNNAVNINIDFLNSKEIAAYCLLTIILDLSQNVAAFINKFELLASSNVWSVNLFSRTNTKKRELKEIIVLAPGILEDDFMKIVNKETKLLKKDTDDQYNTFNVAHIQAANFLFGNKSN